jgi:hypothetical protein
MQDDIVNKVAGSGIVSVDLEEYYPAGDRVVFDLKDLLYEGLILKEKDFRAYVKDHDWSGYQDKYVALHCSADAIVPTWAYMLLTTRLEPFARKVVFGDRTDLETALYYEALSRINPEEFRDQRVVVKGCSNLPVPASAYVEITRLLRPFAKSIMYGEPCSTVPLYKKKE